mgnify:CR=1 FL=1
MTEEYINKTREAVDFLTHIYSGDISGLDDIWETLEDKL